jgi:hypothetical protein
MQAIFVQLKSRLKGRWHGDGFAKYPTITSTNYSDELEFIPDENKDAIFFNEKSRYGKGSEKRGETLFWDTGFIVLKENKIFLLSAQVGGRVETYELTDYERGNFVFESVDIRNDEKTLRSQRIITFSGDILEYELNMETHQNRNFENHLTARFTRDK